MVHNFGLKSIDVKHFRIYSFFKSIFCTNAYSGGSYLKTSANKIEVAKRLKSTLRTLNWNDYWILACIRNNPGNNYLHSNLPCVTKNTALNFLEDALRKFNKASSLNRFLTFPYVDSTFTQFTVNVGEQNGICHRSLYNCVTTFKQMVALMQNRITLSLSMNDCWLFRWTIFMILVKLIFVYQHVVAFSGCPIKDHAGRRVIYKSEYHIILFSLNVIINALENFK